MALGNIIVDGNVAMRMLIANNRSEWKTTIPELLHSCNQDC